MTSTLLRNRALAAEGRVTFIELFFDLVFVFAVTQLSHHLAQHLTLRGALESVILLFAVWSVWVYTTWATSWLNTNHPAVRLMFFALTAGGLVLSTSLPEAMEGRGLQFALAVVFMQNARNVFTILAIDSHDPSSRRNFTRIQIWLLIAAVFWVVGGLTHGNARLVWWLVALLCEIGSPWWRYWTPTMGFSTIEDWQVSPHHFAERCGLFIIIAVGESVLVTGATFSGLEWSGINLAAFTVALAGTFAVWWVYFATTADEAAAEFGRARQTGEIARAAYTYAHIPIVAGIILTAVGDEVLLAHPAGRASTSALVVLLGGPALFLVGSALFNRMMCGTYPRSHLAGLLALAGAVLLGEVATPLAIAAAAVLVLWGVGGWESLQPRSA